MTKLITANDSNKTPSMVTILATIVIFIYFLFVWLYYGEFNMSKLNWLIVVETKDDAKILKPNFHPVILLFLLLPLLFPLGLALTLKFTVKKWVGIDIIPLLFPLEVLLITIILTGLIKNPWSFWVVFGRIFICFIGWFTSFMISNKLINWMIRHSRFGGVFFAQKYNEIATSHAQQKELHNAWKLSRGNKKEYLEIPSEDQHSKQKE